MEVKRRKKAKEDYQKTIAFEIGDPNPYGKYFTGKSYLALEIPGERTSTTWHEPVSDEEYRVLG